MNQRECDDFLDAVLDIGRTMVQCGGEISRVEDTISRILKAYDIPRVEVYATTTLIVTTIKTHENITATQSARIMPSSNNLRVLEALNNLSRNICTNKPDIDTIKEMTKQTVEYVHFGFYNSIGYVIAAFAFSIFFGGSLRDGLVAGVIGFLIFLVEKFVNVGSINKLIYTLIMTFFVGALAIFSVMLGIGENVDKIIISIVMLFIPTLAIVNGMKDMFNRDISSGLFRMVEAILTAASIALGIGISVMLLGGLI